jgi:hypothetical protein
MRESSGEIQVRAGRSRGKVSYESSGMDDKQEENK